MMMAILFVAGIAFGQSSPKSITVTNASNINLAAFKNNQGTLLYNLAHDSVNNLFVNGFSVGKGFGSEIMKYAPSGQALWETVFDTNNTVTNTCAESVQHQLVYNEIDNSVVVGSQQVYGINPVLTKFNSNGQSIWQIGMDVEALEIWGENILALQGNSILGTVSLIRNTDGSVESTFSINGDFSNFPMMKVLGDTLCLITNAFFEKVLLPSGQLLWQVPTTDFAEQAIRTYGTLDSHGNVYVFTSDAGKLNQTGGVAGQLFATAKYSSQGKKLWVNEWLGWADTSLADGVSRYNLNNWSNGMTIDESLHILTVFGGTQKAGTVGAETSDQSAYLMFLNSNNGDTLQSSKWDDGSSVVTLWNDGYFNQKDQLVLLGYGYASNTVLVVDNFVTMYDLSITDAVRSHPVQQNSFELSQNYPNPFNPTTTIRFSIPKAGLVTLKVYNILGQEIKTLVAQEMNSGSNEVGFDGSFLPSSTYFYRLTAPGSYTETKKMVLLK